MARDYFMASLGFPFDSELKGSQRVSAHSRSYPGTKKYLKQGPKSRKIRVALDHLELIPWTCSLVAKLKPKELKAAHVTWHSVMYLASRGAKSS